MKGSSKEKINRLSTIEIAVYFQMSFCVLITQVILKLNNRLVETGNPFLGVCYQSQFTVR